VNPKDQSRKSSENKDWHIEFLNNEDEGKDWNRKYAVERKEQKHGILKLKGRERGKTKGRHRKDNIRKEENRKVVF
jgi:hypothetical protein